MNRPVPISVFSDQHRTKSTTRSRTSCGTHTLVRAPQDFFLRRCARPSIRPAPRPWSESFFPKIRFVVVRLGGPAGSCPERPPHRLKEFFLPTVEHRWLQPIFLAQIGNRHFIQQVPPQDGNLLFPSVVLSLFSHAPSPLS